MESSLKLKNLRYEFCIEYRIQCDVFFVEYSKIQRDGLSIENKIQRNGFCV